MLTYSKYSKALGVLFAIAVLATSSCATKSESADAGCQAGAELCSCLSNGGCSDGLTCATNLNQCVRLAGTGTGGDETSGSGGTPSGGTKGTGGTTATGGTTGTGGDGGAGGSAGHAGTGGSGTGGGAGHSGTGGNGTGGSAGHSGTGGNGGASATGGTNGTGGAASTSCGTLSPSASGNGQFTHYYFGQGTAKGELGDYQTACGYLGTENNQVDTVLNIANTSPAKNTYFAAIPGTNGFDSKGNCGACVQITGGNGKTIIATIIDECPYGGDGNNSICQQNPKGELDLSVDAFNQLGYATGNPSGTSWKVVPCPYAGNIIVRVKQSNELYIEGTILAITSVSGPGGSASRTSYGSWHFNSNISAGAQLTLTDAASRMLTVTVASGSVDQNQDTGKQFPTCQ